MHRRQGQTFKDNHKTKRMAMDCSLCETMIDRPNLNNSSFKLALMATINTIYSWPECWHLTVTIALSAIQRDGGSAALHNHRKGPSKQSQRALLYTTFVESMPAFSLTTCSRFMKMNDYQQWVSLLWWCLLRRHQDNKYRVTTCFHRFVGVKFSVYAL